MKLLLSVSLCLNLLFGALLLLRTDAEEGDLKDERGFKVLRKNKKGRIGSLESSSTIVPTQLRSKRQAQDNTAPTFDGPFLSEAPLEVQDLSAAAEKINLDKEDFLSGQLFLSPEQLQDLEAHKRRFQEVSEEIYQKVGVFGDLSIEDRRKLLDLEEDHLKNLAKVMGVANWQRYQKFRKEYNLRLMEAHENIGSEFAPFMLMDL